MVRQYQDWGEQSKMSKIKISTAKKLNEVFIKTACITAIIVMIFSFIGVLASLSSKTLPNIFAEIFMGGVISFFAIFWLYALCDSIYRIWWRKKQLDDNDEKEVNNENED